MSTLTAEEQELFDIAKTTLPSFLFANPNAQQEQLAAFAKIFARAKAQVRYWYRQTFIGVAEEHFLDEHARDRNTRRQDGESDAALQARIPVIDDALTVPALAAAADAILLAAGVTGSSAVVEVRVDRAVMRNTAAENGAGRRCVAYLGRGYRMGRSTRPHLIIVILPYGTDGATADGVREAVRKKKAANMVHLVEVRGVP